MAELFRKIPNIAQAGYGVNLLEKSPPVNVRGQGTSDVGIVMDVPWGPYEVTEVTSLSDLYATFAPGAFEANDEYPSLKALLNKQFPAKYFIKRIAVTGALVAAVTFTSTGPLDSVVVSGRYAGAQGNKIAVEWIDGTTPATMATAIVTVGTAYRKVYKDVVQGTVVTDPGDPFVTFTAAPGISARPTTNPATLLTGGSDGAAVSADWTGTEGNFDGAWAFSDSSFRASVIFGAEVPAAFIDAFNTALLAVASTAVSYPILSTPAGLTRAQAEDYADSYRTDDGRAYMCFPLVKTINFFDPNAGTITVDGNSFAAAAHLNILPEQSPGGAPGRPFLKGITGLESPLTQGDYDSLIAAGVNGFYRTNQGFIMQGGVTTTLTSGLTLASRRRMADYISLSLADYHTGFVGKLLDIDLSNQSLGPVTGPQVKGQEAFLQNLVDAGRIPAYRVDPFAGTEEEISEGIWPIVTEAKLFANQQAIVLVHNIGPTVQISEV